MISLHTFSGIIRDYYQKNKRYMPWREDVSPYSVFVSEIMLQQTQVSRVLEKFSQFIVSFPDFLSLANASQRKLLSVWQGMGYNRRALYLKRAAQIILKKYKGIVPMKPELLDELPGIGKATACSICAFTYNTPVVFIETNIRKVFIHFFFQEKNNIDDREILPLVEKTLDINNPREWYWALMDYGAYLSKRGKNPNKKSKQYIKQKPFVGSTRQIRGILLSLLLKRPYSVKEIKTIFKNEKRIETILKQLKKEGFIQYRNKTYIVL